MTGQIVQVETVKDYTYALTSSGEVWRAAAGTDPLTVGAAGWSLVRRKRA